MTCERINTELDDYLDGDIAPDARWELDAHVQYCEACQATLEQARQLQQALRSYPVSGPTPGFLDRALAVARESEKPVAPESTWTVRRTSALAAGFAVLALGGLFLQNPEVTGSDSGVSSAVAGVSLAVHETRTVNLLFASATDLQGVSLTVQLPDGVELAGYSGSAQVSWTTRLEAGKNVLPLELVAVGGSGGELVARLQHEGDEKVFTVSVAVI